MSRTKDFIKSWNNFWLHHKISNLVLWNIIVLVPFCVSLVDLAFTKDGGMAEGIAIGIYFCAPIVLGVLLFDFAYLVKRLINKHQ